ncbi:MAG: OpgC protein [Edaphobacter sp.]|nr:OpgC protein [Edaphobacter sp.]
MEFGLLSRTSVPRYRRLTSADLLPATARYLPMYVIFLLIAPFLLAIAARRGWKNILLAGGSVWLLEQFGLRAWVHDVVVHVTTLQIPLQDTGSFNLFAWQMVWVSGLCIGATSVQEGRSFRRPPVSFIRSAPSSASFHWCAAQPVWEPPHSADARINPSPTYIQV